jgi:uncharacterized protein
MRLSSQNALKNRMEYTNTAFEPDHFRSLGVPWLPGGHAQSIWPALFGRAPRPVWRRERWELDDGDFIDADWLDAPRALAPVLVLFHGLEGSSSSHYARAVASAAHAAGYAVCAPHFRGCSGEPNRLPRAYHSGDGDEIERMLLRARKQGVALYAVGVSLGGSALLNYLATRADAALPDAAATVCAPLDLAACGHAIGKGFSMVYTRMFLRTLKAKSAEKLQRFPGMYDPEKMHAARNLYDFDNLVTAPLHGFRDTDDYWSRASSKPVLRAVKAPVLVINPLNDPFVPKECLPGVKEVSPQVMLSYPRHGGHVGFATGAPPGRLTWLPQTVLDYFGHG